MKPTAPGTRLLIHYGIGAAFGAAYAIVLYKLLGPTDDLPSKASFVVSFFVMFAGSFIIARRVTPGWPVGAFLFAGIVCGVFVNAIYDGFFHHVDHNLFPLEIVFLVAFAMPGVLAGLLLAWFRRGVGEISN